MMMMICTDKLMYVSCSRAAADEQLKDDWQGCFHPDFAVQTRAAMPSCEIYASIMVINQLHCETRTAATHPVKMESGPESDSFLCYHRKLYFLRKRKK